MKDFYQYPAIFDIDEDGISIFFPDLPGCLPCADNMQNAFKNAKEALQLHLNGMEEDGEAIPAPFGSTAIKLKQHQTLAMIETCMPPSHSGLNVDTSHRLNAEAMRAINDFQNLLIRRC